MYTSASGDVDLQPSRASGWVGWIVFAAAMMIISGIFSIVWGIVALVRDEVFLVGRSGNVVNLNYTTWGWVNLVLGIIVLVSGLFLFRGSVIASIVAVILAMLSMIGNLLDIASYPIWSTIVIAVDVLVIYALTVHGHETREDYY
jgi:hypothetical protein